MSWRACSRATTTSTWHAFSCWRSRCRCNMWERSRGKGLLSAVSWGGCSRCRRSSQSRGELTIPQSFVVPTRALTSHVSVQQLVVPFSGIAGLTYTFQFREIQSDAFLQMSEKLETHFFDVDSDSITDQPLFLNARVAPTGSLAAVPVGLNTSLDGFHGYVDSRQGGWFNWVCPGTGSWSLLLDGQCQPGQTSCMLGFEVHISGSDRSEEDGALECTGPVGECRLFTPIICSLWDRFLIPSVMSCRPAGKGLHRAPRHSCGSTHQF